MSWLSPKQLLPVLLGAALAAGGRIQLLQAAYLLKNQPSRDPDEVAALQQEVDQLTRENRALRALAREGMEAGSLPCPTKRPAASKDNRP